MIAGRLYRPHTRYVEGKHVRDLTVLDRDIRRVLFVSANPNAYHLQPDNCIKVPRWRGDLDGPVAQQDTILLDLLPFLDMVKRTDVKDFRDIVKSFDGQDLKSAFRERMQAFE